MARDRETDALHNAAAPTLEEIRRHRARAPGELKKVFTVIARCLFDLKLNAMWAWEQAGIRNHALTAVFKDLTGLSLKPYIARARINVAEVLLQTTDWKLSTISVLIGYLNHPTFADNYLRVKKILPSQVPRMAPKQQLIDDATAQRAVRADLDEDEAVDFLSKFLRIYPHTEKPAQPAADATPKPLYVYVIDGGHTDLIAEGLWQKIRDLPFEEQCQHVRQFLFHSTVLFDLLRKKSRLEGHKKRQRGIQVAKLALVSLERSDQVFGERIHDLRALGWAWLANAIRLALDFASAAAAFEQADREWSKLRAQPDLVVLAHICCLKGVLQMMRREYAQATEDLDHSCSLFRQSGQACDEALALIHRASVHIYAGNPGEAIEDLREAAGLVDEDQERELAFALRGNLANAFVQAGDAGCAAKELERARQLNRHIDDPLGAIKLDWIEGDLAELHGDLEQAKSLYKAARAGFNDVDEMRYFGIVSVDLMTIHSQQGEWERVGDLASKTLPLLTSMRLHSETVAAVSLLAEAVKAGTPSHRLLKDLRVALRQDPLVM